MPKTMLRWALKKPGQPVEEQVAEISYKNDDERSEKELKLAQQLVDGYVEVVWIGGDVKAIVNEEAMYRENMLPNCGFLGTIVFFRGDSAWFGSLTDEDVRKLKMWTVTHENDVHPGDVPPQIFFGQAAEEYRKRLHDAQKLQQQEWESL